MAKKKVENIFRQSIYHPLYFARWHEHPLLPRKMNFWILVFYWGKQLYAAFNQPLEIYLAI